MIDKIINSTLSFMNFIGRTFYFPVVKATKEFIGFLIKIVRFVVKG